MRTPMTSEDVEDDDVVDRKAPLKAPVLPHNLKSDDCIK